jgi:hypothetical protein
MISIRTLRKKKEGFHELLTDPWFCASRHQQENKILICERQMQGQQIV